MNTPETNPATGRMEHFWKVVLTVIVFALVLKIPTLNLPHTEGDEIAFWHLANNWIKTGKYTDKGDDLTPYPAYVDRFTRDMPVHPPAFAALLVPFAKYGALNKAVMASWLGHILAILAVALIGRHVYRGPSGVSSAFSPYFWLPLLGIATDPVMTWISGILWIDNLDAGFAALAIAFAIMARDSQRQGLMWTLSGVLLGLGLLSKVTAAAIVPVLVYQILMLPGKRERVTAALYCAAPALLLSLPWYLPLYLTMGEFIVPKPHLPPSVFVAPPCPFCELAGSRPFYYFFLKICLVVPVALVCTAFLAVAFRRRESGEDAKRWAELLFPWVWFLLIVVAATLAGSFIMRRISILYPAIYVMLYFLLRHFDTDRLQKYQPALLFFSAIAMIYAGIGGGIYLFNGNFAEFFSPLELAGVVNLWGAR